MSTNPLEIKKSSWQYKLWSIWSFGTPPKRAWHYRMVVGIMLGVYMMLGAMVVVVLLSALLFVLAAISPVVLHFWPGSTFFSFLRERMGSDVARVLQFWVAVTPPILLVWALRFRLQRVGEWLWARKPPPRSIRLLDD